MIPAATIRPEPGGGKREGRTIGEVTHPGSSPPPADGFTVPPAPHGTKRIPDDIAFTVRPKWIVAVGLGAVPVLFAVLFLGAALALLPDLTRKPMFLLVAFVVFLTTLIPGVFMTMTMGTGGPLAACDDTGLWLRVRHYPAKALFLPWQDVSAVYTRRWGLQRLVCVQPRDPRAGTGMGALADLDRFSARMVAGSSLIIPTLHADTKMDEILRVFAHYARGRCRFETW